MIIGNGLLAKAFNIYQNNDNILIFASGVSNSLEVDSMVFKRERDLLLLSLQKNQNKLFIYFSTCSIYDSSVNKSPYVQHKIKMENLIRNNHSNYFIFRLSNIVGFGGNKGTLINFFYDKIKSKQSFDIWKNATRNILDAQDAVCIIEKVILEKKPNVIINIAHYNSYKIESIVNSIENYLKIKGNYALKNKGENINIDVSEIEEYFNKIIGNEMQTLDYIHVLLDKYYL